MNNNYNSLADVVRLLVERFDTKSNVKLGGFRSQLQASYVSSHTEELWYNESLSVDDYIYIKFFFFFFIKTVLYQCSKHKNADQNKIKNWVQTLNSEFHVPDVHVTLHRHFKPLTNPDDRNFHCVCISATVNQQKQCIVACFLYVFVCFFIKQYTKNTLRE